MTTCYAALRGKFGVTEYHLISMPVGELVSNTRVSVEIPEWENLSIEERYQRELNINRIKHTMAPYFANDEKRFSGALIMAVRNHEKMLFEPMSKFQSGSSMPALYQTAAAELGFLTMHGQEILEPLDGQHRVRALKMAIEGHAEQGEVVLQPKPEIAKDKIAVILVKFNTETARYIFNKVNRYAKPTRKSDNLITDDDDAVAVLTRRLFKKGPIPEHLVSRSNSLKTGGEFTTLATLYESNKKLLLSLPLPSTSKPEKMDEREKDRRLPELVREWRRLVDGLGPWKEALRDIGKDGDDVRIELRKKYILCRPVGQQSAINGYARACRDGLGRDKIVAKLDRIGWDVNNSLWRDLLVRPNGRIRSGKIVSNNAGTLIVHLVGVQLGRKEEKGLLEAIYGPDSSNKRLPPRT